VYVLYWRCWVWGGRLGYEACELHGVSRGSSVEEARVRGVGSRSQLFFGSDVDVPGVPLARIMDRVC